MRSIGVNPSSRTRARIPGERNEAGSKLIRGFYKAKHGTRGTFDEARKWYAGLK